MRILTSSEVREALSSVQAELPVLIQRAGYAVAQFCASQFKFSSASVICGNGTKGACGMVAAAALRRVAEHVAVIILAQEASELSVEAAACLSPDLQTIWISGETDLEADNVREALDADLIVDAVADADSEHPLEGVARSAVQAINGASGTIVSVDLPSGANPDGRAPIQESDGNIVFAHGIIALFAPKPAHVFGDLTPGPIAVSEIGAQPVLVSNRTGLDVVTGRDVRIAFPARQKTGDKNQFGHVLVIAGSLGKAGAAILAGMAALSAGAGLVTVACPRSIQATVAGFNPSLMTLGLAETPEGTISTKAAGQVDLLLADKDAIVIGPGLSRNEETAEFVREVVANPRLPIVIDADGLNAFENHYGRLRSQDTTQFRALTLSPGEAGRMMGVSIADVQSDRVETARCVARTTGSCVVLTGSRTVIAGASGETWMNMTGNPALAKGGSGDVLCGLIGAVLARRHESATPTGPPQELAFLRDLNVAAAVHLHGLAGDLVRDALHEHTVLATDVLDGLARAFRDCEAQAEQALFYLQK